MDSPIVAQLFRQFFRHRPCQKACWQSRQRLDAVRHRRSYYSIRSGRGCNDTSTQPPSTSYRRLMSSKGRPKTTNESDWQQRSDVLPLDMSAEYQTYAIVTAQELRGRRERPKRVRMLTRDFIEGTGRFQFLP